MNEKWNNNIVREAGTFFNCEKCDTKTKLYNEAKVVIFTCPNCGKIYSKQNPNYDTLNPVYVNKHVYAAQLYSKCSFDDVEYTVVGASCKHEKGNKHAKWQELVLADNLGRYAFLNVSYGHWVFLKERLQPLNFKESSKDHDFLNDDGREYTLFSSFYQMTETCIGEFPYDVIDVKTRFSKEYISPPFLFTYEHHKSEKSFFEGVYQKPEQVSNAFNNKNITLPLREGTGSCQPSPLNFNHRNFLRLSIVLVLTAFALLKFLVGDQSAISLASANIVLPDSVKTEKVVSSSFTLPQTALLRFDNRTTVSNDWLELGITLINEKTGEEKSFVAGYEFYSGYDDGYWAEGDPSGSSYLNHVAPGKYHAEVEVLGSGKPVLKTVDVSILWDHPTSWNFWVLFGFIGGITAIVYIIGEKFEKQRIGFINQE